MSHMPQTSIRRLYRVADGVNNLLLSSTVNRFPSKYGKQQSRTRIQPRLSDYSAALKIRRQANNKKEEKLPDRDKELIEQLEKADKEVHGLQYYWHVWQLVKSNAANKSEDSSKRAQKEKEQRMAKGRSVLASYADEHRRALKICGRLNTVFKDGYKIKDVYVTNNPKGRNAGAWMDGRITLDSGLFIAGWKDDHLAYIIGHEIGHLKQKHVNETRSIGVQSTFYDQSAKALKHISSQHIHTQILRVLSVILMKRCELKAYGLNKEYYAMKRSNEFEADEIGMLIMRAAGYQDQACIEWEEYHCERETKNPPKTDYIWRTHPTAQERLDKIRTCIMREREYDDLYGFDDESTSTNPGLLSPAMGNRKPDSSQDPNKLPKPPLSKPPISSPKSGKKDKKSKK